MDRFGSRNRRDGITSRFRLRGYDYSTPGYYFVTICIQDRRHLLGDIRDDVVRCSPAGAMIDALWQEVPGVFPDAVVDSYVTMPNHVHAIIGLGIDNPDTSRVSLDQVVQWVKSMSTHRYIRSVKTLGWTRFDGHLWQDGYHDHIVREGGDLDRLREYIEANPSQWARDEFWS